MNPSIKIIAEVGVNHNGDANIAIELARLACDAGADIVKYQSFDAEELVLPTASTTKYQKDNTQKEYQIKLLKKLQLSENDQSKIKNYCDKIGIEFLSTGFEQSSLKTLIQLGIKRIKIPSGEITNTPFLEFISAQKLPIILSTGMSSLDEVIHAYHTLVNNGVDKNSITVLHCTSNYPAAYDELNLRALTTIANTLGTDVGYSDHSIGNEASLAAAALGATIIEKHITLEKTMDGPDHKASMEINDFKDFVKSIRRIEVALGQTTKQPSATELSTRELVRKSIVSTQVIRVGDVFDTHNLTTKRPGFGLSAVRWNDLIGKTAMRNYSINELIDPHEI